MRDGFAGYSDTKTESKTCPGCYRVHWPWQGVCTRCGAWLPVAGTITVNDEGDFSLELMVTEAMLWGIEDWKEKR